MITIKTIEKKDKNDIVIQIPQNEKGEYKNRKLKRQVFGIRIEFRMSVKTVETGATSVIKKNLPKNYLHASQAMDIYHQNFTILKREDKKTYRDFVQEIIEDTNNIRTRYINNAQKLLENNNRFSKNAQIDNVRITAFPHRI